MARRLVALTVFLMGCVPPVGERASMPSVQPAAVDQAGPVIAPLVEVSTPEPARPEPLADAPCVAVTGCRIVARHRLESRFAREAGFYRSRAGLVASRYSNWRARGRPEDTFFVEVTEACEVPTGYYIQSATFAWFPFPQSCGPETCAGSTGYYFAPVATRFPHRFRPLGHGFFEDGHQVFDRDAPLEAEPPADLASFHACERASDEEAARRFVPAAQDAHGLFGWGEHGDLSRARR